MTFSQKGRLIVFEGIDGSGKTTQAQLLTESLRNCGIECILTAEPSDGPIGRLIRTSRVRFEPTEEARLFTEDRREHVLHVVAPSLAQGITVVCDRYVYSSMAYQGARGVDPAAIWEENTSFAPQPDVTFFLDISVETALARIKTRRSIKSPFESCKDLAVVARMYRDLQGPGWYRINGQASVTEVHAKIIKIIKPLFVHFDKSHL